MTTGPRSSSSPVIQENRREISELLAVPFNGFLLRVWLALDFPSGSYYATTSKAAGKQCPPYIAAAIMTATAISLSLLPSSSPHRPFIVLVRASDVHVYNCLVCGVVWISSHVQASLFIGGSMTISTGEIVHPPRDDQMPCVGLFSVGAAADRFDC